MLAWLICVALIVVALLLSKYNYRVQNWFRHTREDIGCAPLRRKALMLTNYQQDVVDRLVALARRKSPGKTERWYLEKVIYDLQRRR